ncbi:MAG: L-threonylcarbamoyladenylate synthase [Candidatus Bipolaricaulota bacterium]|nr:L-threonylcarbamoyladenylate synthase [Candidatus Bipolaricaulota bacterium]MDW8329954.1 L-threonylcarbamoyladenylate synthase [Candidatus Bipolaricaulota bacterium]
MRTEVLVADETAIRRAAEVIRGGGLVAFPTETVYGLGADALNERAVRRIFEAKERPSDNPLIVHIAQTQELERLARAIPERAWDVAQRFWPGPLTLVLERAACVPTVTTGGLETVAVRVPAHPVAQQLLRESGCPIAAPSANRFGRPSPTRAQHVLEDLNGRIELILDGGPTLVGLESTVLDMTQDPPMVLRPGGVTLEELRAVLGEVRTLEPTDREAARRSPGTRYRHYAPQAKLLLAEYGQAEVLVRELLAQGRRVGVLLQRALKLGDGDLVVQQMPTDLESYAQQLFAALRELDAQGVDVIVVESVEERGLGRAIMDRLRRAAGRTY